MLLQEETLINKVEAQMIYRSYTACMFCVALTAVSFVTGASKATAQITYPFEATYDAAINSTLLEQTNEGIIVRTDVESQSANAPYGLTNLDISSYTRINTTTGAVTFNSDPVAVGLKGQPFGTLSFFGEGEDKLYGTIEGTASLAQGTGTGGTITITAGEGRFDGATGSLNLTQVITSSPDPTGISEPILTLNTVQGSFQAVPEPGSVLGTLTVGIGGAALLLKRKMNTNKVAIKP